MTAKTLAQHDELMKKTETMSVLMETNKMLRMEKERMEQELQQTQAKVRRRVYFLRVKAPNFGFDIITNVNILLRKPSVNLVSV